MPRIFYTNSARSGALHDLPRTRTLLPSAVKRPAFGASVAGICHADWVVHPRTGPHPAKLTSGGELTHVLGGMNHIRLKHISKLLRTIEPPHQAIDMKPPPHFNANQCSLNPRHRQIYCKGDLQQQKRTCSCHKFCKRSTCPYLVDIAIWSETCVILPRNPYRNCLGVFTWRVDQTKLLR